MWIGTMNMEYIKYIMRVFKQSWEKYSNMQLNNVMAT